MYYIIAGLIIGALIYRQGIIDGMKVSSKASLSNNPIRPIMQKVNEKKEDKVADEFSESLKEMLSFTGDIGGDK